MPTIVQGELGPGLANDTDALTMPNANKTKTAFFRFLLMFSLLWFQSLEVHARC
jgi:hypothetical protein